LEYTEDGKRARRKVSGKTRVAVVDKLRELRADLHQGIVPKTGHANYTVCQTAEDWLANGWPAARPARRSTTSHSSIPRSCHLGQDRRIRDVSERRGAALY
jgi:hypothetical protein